MNSKDTFNNNATGTQNHSLQPPIHQRRSAITLREEHIGDPERDPILIGFARLQLLEDRIKEFLRHEMREDEIHENYDSPEEFEQGVNRIFHMLITNCEETLINDPNDNQSPNNNDDESVPPPSPTLSISSTKTPDPGKSFLPKNNFGLEWSTPSLKKFDYVPRKVRHKNKESTNEDKIIIPSPFTSKHDGINSSDASLNVNISDSEASSLTSIDSVVTECRPISPTFSKMFAKSKHKNKVKMKGLRNFGAPVANGNSSTRKSSAGKKSKSLAKKQIIRPWPKQKKSKSMQKESTLSKYSILKVKNVASNTQLVCSPIGSRPQSPNNNIEPPGFINIIPEDYFTDMEEFSLKEDSVLFDKKKTVDGCTEMIKPMNNDSEELIYLHVGSGLPKNPGEKETVLHSSDKSTNFPNDLKTHFRKKVRITFDIDEESALDNHRSNEDLTDQTRLIAAPLKSEDQDFHEDINEENSMNNNNSNDPAEAYKNEVTTYKCEHDTSQAYKVYDYMISDNYKKAFLKSTIESVLKKVKKICSKTSLLQKNESPATLKHDFDENFNQDNKEGTQNLVERLEIENNSPTTNKNGNASLDFVHKLKDIANLTRTFKRSTTNENKSDTSDNMIEKPTSSSLSISPNDFGLEERILMLQVENILDTATANPTHELLSQKTDVAISTSDLLPKYCRPQFLQPDENLMKFLPRIPSSNSGLGLSFQASEIFRRYEFMHSSSTEAAGAEANSKNIWLSPFTKYSKKKTTSRKFKDIQKKSYKPEKVTLHKDKKEQRVMSESPSEKEKISFIVGPSPVEPKKEPFIPKVVKKLKRSKQNEISSDTNTKVQSANQSKQIINVKRTAAVSKLPVPIEPSKKSKKTP